MILSRLPVKVDGFFFMYENKCEFILRNLAVSGIMLTFVPSMNEGVVPE